MMRWLALAAAALTLVGAAKPPLAVDPSRLSDIVKGLASDDFEGRNPGTAGETKTIDYLSGIRAKTAAARR